MPSVLAVDLTPQLSGWWAPVVAFVAGLVSFASPCVFPLVPGYLSFISGEQVVDGRPRRNLTPILLFIAGFTVVFTLYGAFAHTFVEIFRGPTGQRVAGLVVVVLGVLMIGYAVGRGSVKLYGEKRPFLHKVRPGVAGAFPLGMAFAAGWTPCVGPVLGALLALGLTGSSARSAGLLVCYSLGLGLPFLVLGLGVQTLMGALGWVRRNYRAISAVSGTVLVVLGVMLITGTFTRYLNAPLQRFGPGL
jgi:cytochrome c-type biogenesis protein